MSSYLYRAMMLASDGWPMVGRSALKLGVRIPETKPLVTDIDVAPNGGVQPRTGGMSTSDSFDALPEFRRNSDVPVWRLPIVALGSKLAARADPKNRHHIFVEPAFRCKLSTYEDALAATRHLWERVR